VTTSNDLNHTKPGRASTGPTSLYETFFRATSQPAAVCDLVFDDARRVTGCRLLDVNRAWEVALGIDRVAAIASTKPLPAGLDPAHWLSKCSEAVETGRAVTFEAAATAGIRAYRVTMVPISKAAVAMILEDVTDRRRLDVRLGDALRFEAIGPLAGSVAHDLNNLLSAIVGYGELLRSSLSSGDPRLHDVDEIRRASESAAHLTRQLLDLSRPREAQFGLVDLNRVVHGMENLLRRLLGAEIELTTALASGLGSVQSDPSQIEQVILNLVVNARDAMPAGGFVSLETRMQQISASQAAELDLEPGLYVVLEIRDTGIGMDEATRSRAFEPFFTTKEHGTGLGLSTVREVLKRSHGAIDLRTGPQRGASFALYLPASRESGAALAPARPTAAPGN
jgi:signal transduction histidine kinase